MLKFTLKNFRAVESADLELPGITIIAGKNGSGKSSISKVLYAILDTAARFETFVTKDVDEKKRHLFSDVVDLVLNFAYQLPDLSRDQIRRLFPSSNTTSPQSWAIEAKSVFIDNQVLVDQHRDVLSNFLERAHRVLDIKEGKCLTANDLFDVIKTKFDLFDMEREEKTYSRPIDVLNERVLNILEQPVDFETTNVFFNNDQLVKVQTKRLDSPVDIKSVFYIDTPLVSDLCDMSLNRFADRRLEHREHLARALRTPAKVTSSQIYDVMKSIVHGETESKKTPAGYRLMFKSDDFNQVFSLFHCATGVKAFSLLQLLLSNHKIDDGTLLILDEPESNLHPEWIVEYARAVVLLHKNFGVRFLISTHSTDFVAAIQAISKNEDQESSVRFYLAEKQLTGGYQFASQGFDISKIFDSFNISLDKISMYGAEL